MGQGLIEKVPGRFPVDTHSHSDLFQQSSLLCCPCGRAPSGSVSHGHSSECTKHTKGHVYLCLFIVEAHF